MSPFDLNFILSDDDIERPMVSHRESNRESLRINTTANSNNISNLNISSKAKVSNQFRSKSTSSKTIKRDGFNKSNLNTKNKTIIIDRAGKSSFEIDNKQDHQIIIEGISIDGSIGVKSLSFD